MVPSCATAGELKMMSPVAYDHLIEPSRATSYNLPSCDPTRMDPSPATAGDETIGPPVANVHQTAGLTAGKTKGERPRWLGPKRNIACAGSIAYCGRGTDGDSPPAATEGRVVSPGQTQRPASQSRLSLQSVSDAHCLGSTVAQPAPISRAMAAATRRVTRRPPCVEPVNTEPGTRDARTARGAGRTRPATDIEFGWRKVKANWKSCKLV